MLKVNEFSAGELNTAKPLSLLRPIVNHEQEALVAGSNETPVAVILQDEYAYQWFETASSSDWTGLIIPNLSVEVDETSAFNLNFDRSPLGAAVRTKTELAICVKAPGRNGLSYVTLVNDLPSLGEHKVGFKRWQLVLGERNQKRIIRVFDLTRTAKS